MHHLYQALRTLALKRWQRFMADSQMIQYYQVLQKVKKKSYYGASVVVLFF